MSPVELLLFLFISFSALQAQTIQFTEVTDWHKSVDNSALVCSVSDFYRNNNSNLYWVEYNANRAYQYDYTGKNNVISNIFANVYDNTLSRSLFNYSITNNQFAPRFQNTTSLPQSCRNPVTNDIITSYSIGYFRDDTDGKKIPFIKYANNTISTHISVYWKIFSMNTLQLSEATLAFDSLKQPYDNENTTFNYNFNANVLCFENYYLISWYHWDQYQTYLQYRIIYKNSNNKYVQTEIISATTTMLFNVSLLINAFGRTKTIQSKWDNSLFMGVYNNYDRKVLITKPFNQPVEYATLVKGIIGKIDTTNTVPTINWVTKTPFALNQITSTAAIGYETGTLQSGYVKVELNPNNNNPGCCFVVLYGQTYGIPVLPEVWGICRLYMTMVNDAGNHVISEKTESNMEIFNFANLLGICNPYDPGNLLFEGFFGNAQVIELDMLRTNTESYFMVAFTTNFAFHSEVRGIVYKLYYNTGKKEYVVETVKTNLESKNEFISFDHPTKKTGRITVDVCFHVNNGNKQLFVGYTLNNVTDDLLQNNETLKQPLMTRVYGVSLSNIIV